MHEDQPAVVVKELYKTFKLPHEQHSGIKQAIVNIFNSKKGYEKQEVLADISFEIKKGEFFGIVGRNGSGKSTMLKLLAGIYAPDKGLVQVNGTLTPFIELGVGFNPELTGRENVFMNGALLGFGKKEMEVMYDDIVDFAELERFMDQKLKNYSSGMQVRLAFSIAIRARSDVLLIDEVLAVGDSAFQQKCFDYFERLKKEKRTIIFVTHDMSAVRRFCTRAVLVEKGKMKMIGTPESVASQYLLDNIETDQDGLNQNKKGNLSKEVLSLSVKSIPKKSFHQNDTLELKIEYMLSQDIEVDIGYSISSNGFSLAEQNTKAIQLPSARNKKHSLCCEIPLTHFNPGSYTVDVAIFVKENFHLIGYEVGAIDFIISGTDRLRGGPMKADGVWEII